MAFGLETASIKAPDLLILGVAGEPFFGSFTLDESLTLSSSSGQVGEAEVAAVLPSSLFHFSVNGDARVAPFGHIAGGLVCPSWAGVTGCADPLDKGLAPLPEQRPPNVGNLDTMTDLKDALFSMRCQEWHEETAKHAQLGRRWKTEKANEEAFKANSSKIDFDVYTLSAVYLLEQMHVCFSPKECC